MLRSILEDRLVKYIATLLSTVAQLESNNKKLIELGAVGSRRFRDNKALIKAYNIIIDHLEQMI